MKAPDGDHLLGRGFGLGAQAPAVLHHRVVAEGDVHPLRVEAGAGAPQGRHDPAPVDVFPGHGGLDQGREGHGQGGLFGLGRGGRALNLHPVDVPGPFAVGHHLPGQLAHDLGHRLAQGRHRRPRRLNHRISRPAAGQQEDGVVGGGVAVHGDPVKACGQGLAQQGFQNLGAWPRRR